MRRDEPPRQGTRIGATIVTPTVIVRGLESPHRAVTRPQDWAEPARSIIFGEARRRIRA